MQHNFCRTGYILKKESESKTHEEENKSKICMDNYRSGYSKTTAEQLLKGAHVAETWRSVSLGLCL
jgi:hypothetical protein